MKKRTKRAYQILKDIRDNIDSVNLNTKSFFSRKGVRELSVDYLATRKSYAVDITLPRAKEYNTTCCLGGMIPMVDWKWAKKHGLDFADMSTEISFTLHRKNTSDDQALWNWIFSEQWNNNKKWAKERLNLVIKKRKCYEMDFALNYSDVNTMSDFIQIAFKNKKKKRKYTYLLKGNKL